MKHRQLQCPFFLLAQCMQIIDAYIKLLKVHESLIKRPGGTVYLETACLVAIMKRDGEKDETIEANYPNRGTSQCPGLVQRVLAYLKHDMVAIFYAGQNVYCLI